jgi:succinyl-CoA synthetase beta subunit
LSGWRGRPRLDIEGAANAVRVLSEVASASPGIAEVEINPLLVLEQGVLGLDARTAIED